MAPKDKADKELSMPVVGMLLLGAAGGIVTAASFGVINQWPVPVGTSPYFGASGGLVWGTVVGALMGLVLGFLLDDKYFSKSE